MVTQGPVDIHGEVPCGVVVSIRSAPGTWLWLLVWAALELVFAGSYRLMDSNLFALCWLALSCITVTQAMWVRSMGVDLTPELAIVRGYRRTRVPWAQVQAVVQRRRWGVWVVQLVLEEGKPVWLRAPTTGWNFGDARYERDFHRIGQWWLDHRGEAWRPLRTEAPAQSP